MKDLFFHQWKQKITELPVLEGALEFNMPQEQAVNVATQMITSLALDIARALPNATLRKIERFDFNIIGAKWLLNQDILSVSIYPDKSNGMVKVHTGVFDSGNAQPMMLFRNHVLALLDKLAEQHLGFPASWQQ